MKIIRYLFEYISIIILFGLFKLLGYKISSEVGYLLGKTFGKFFRSKKIIKDNLIKFDNSLSPEKIKKITSEMWGNYGRILSEYPYISNVAAKDVVPVLLDPIQNIFEKFLFDFTIGFTLFVISSTFILLIF